MPVKVAITATRQIAHLMTLAWRICDGADDTLSVLKAISVHMSEQLEILIFMQI